MLHLGMLLALACALVTNLAFLCKHRGAAAAATVSFRHPLASAAALFRSRWWSIGFGLAAVAWAIHVAALAIAPLSVVQTVISGGLVLLIWPAERWFGIRLGDRERLGLLLSAIGLALLTATSAGASSDPHSGYSTAAMISFEAAALCAGILLLFSGHQRGAGGRGPALLGGAAGLLIGVSDVAVKALAGTVPGDVAAILSPWTAVALLAGAIAFLALGRGLQVGDPIPVITFSSVAANLAAVMGGLLVFGDPLGTDPLGIAARAVAFAAVITAAALMPAPIRTARTVA